MTAPTRGGADEIREQGAGSWGELVSFTAALAVRRARRGLLTEKEIRDALDEAYRQGQASLRQRLEEVAKELDDHAAHAVVEGAEWRGKERARWAGRAAAYLTSRDYVRRALDGDHA